MVAESIAEGIEKQADWPPMMEWAEFADWVRVERGVMENWGKRGYVPTMRFGKHRTVNIVRLLELLE